MGKIILNCSQCGGTLEVTDEMDLFKCQYCDMPYMVKRSDGSVQIVQLEQRVAKIEREQENLRRNAIESEWRELTKEREVIVGKRRAQSGNIRKPARSLTNLFERALKLKREYIEVGGSDPRIIGMPNPIEISQKLQEVFPEYSAKVVPFGSNTRNEPEVLVKKSRLTSARIVCLPNGVKTFSMSRSFKKEIYDFLNKYFHYAK
jgi:DNA-directed RNA polymerase subunit RPC12/RpoP